MKKSKELTQTDMVKFVEKYLQVRMDNCRNNEEYEEAEKASKYFREIMDRDKKPYKGLSIEDCIELMNRKRSVAYDIEREVRKMCNDAIISRTKYFDQNQGCGEDEWCSALPFALRVQDKDDCDIEKCYTLVMVKRDGNHDYLYLVRFDEKGDQHDEFIGWEDRAVSIYQDLCRMGYFDPKYESDFMD